MSALALCTHYFAAVCVVPETVWLIRTLRVGGALTRGRVIAGLGPLLVTIAALAPLAVHQNDGRARYIAVSGSLPYRFVAFIKQDIVGFSWPGTVSIALVGVALTAAGCALWSRADRQERAGARPAVVIGAAVVALAVMTAVGSDYVDTRNLLRPEVAARHGGPGRIRLRAREQVEAQSHPACALVRSHHGRDRNAPADGIHGPLAGESLQPRDRC